MPEAKLEPASMPDATPALFRLGQVNNARVKDVLHHIQRYSMEDPRSTHQLLSLFQPEEFTNDAFHVLSPNTKPQTLWDQVEQAASNQGKLTTDQKGALTSLKYFALQSLAQDPQEHMMCGGQKRVLNESVRDAAKAELREYDAYLAKTLDPEDPASARFFNTANVVGKVAGKVAEAGGTMYLMLNLMSCSFGGGPIPSRETAMPPAITAQAIESRILDVGRQISIVTGAISIPSAISGPDCTPGASTQPLIVELAGSSTEQPLPLAICSADFIIGETKGQGALFTEVKHGQIGRTYIAFGEGSLDQRHGELVPIVNGIADRQTPDRLRYEITTDTAGNVTGMDVISPAGNGGPYHVDFDQAGGSSIAGLFAEALASIVLHSDISVADATALPSVETPSPTLRPTDTLMPTEAVPNFYPGVAPTLEQFILVDKSDIPAIIDYLASQPSLLPPGSKAIEVSTISHNSQSGEAHFAILCNYGGQVNRVPAASIQIAEQGIDPHIIISEIRNKDGSRDYVSQYIYDSYQRNFIFGYQRLVANPLNCDDKMIATGLSAEAIDRFPYKVFLLQQPGYLEAVQQWIDTGNVPEAFKYMILPW